jgi:hypothetical protein
MSRAGIFRICLTDEILAEALRVYKRAHRGIDEERLYGIVIDGLKGAYRPAFITGHENLIPVMNNPPKHRHVLAAAVRGRVDVIVANDGTQRFPKKVCEPYGIEVQHPDIFLCHQWDLVPESASESLNKWFETLTPPRTKKKTVEKLRPLTPEFCKRVSKA